MISRVSTVYNPKFNISSRVMSYHIISKAPRSVFPFHFSTTKCNKFVRKCSSAAGKTASSSAGSGTTSKGNAFPYFGILAPLRYAWVRRGIRVVRVAVLAVLIYQTGFQSGLVHFAQDPEKVEEELMKTLLNLGDGDRLQDALQPSGSLQHRRVKRVGARMLESARQHSHRELLAAQERHERVTERTRIRDRDIKAYNAKQMGAAATAAVPSSNKSTSPAAGEEDGHSRGQPQKQTGKVTLAEEVGREACQAAFAHVEFWQRACRRLEGRWGYLVVRSSDANAFVSGLCPRRVFVFEGLLSQLNLSDDELAMVIGHELSHVVLGHTEDQVPRSAVLLGTQLVVMTLVDPIGIFSFFFDMAAQQLRKIVAASYSRDQEHEADELGLLLVSTSCYDVRAAVSLHQKLEEMQMRQLGLLDDTTSKDQPSGDSSNSSSGLPEASAKTQVEGTIIKTGANSRMESKAADSYGSTDSTGSTVSSGSSSVGKAPKPLLQTGWYDSHPSSAERQARVAEQAARHEKERLDASSPAYDKYRQDCVRYRGALKAIGLDF